MQILSIGAVLFFLLHSCLSSITDIDVKSICNGDNEGRKNAFRLTRISQVSQLADKLTDFEEDCRRYVKSFEELRPLLRAVQEGHICNLETAALIRNYHENFIVEGASNEIPDSLAKFFKSLCFQISAECKMALINNLEFDTKDKISSEDYEQIAYLERHGATLLGLDEEINDFDDIILLEDLVDSAQDSSSESSRIIVKAKTSSLMKQFIQNCHLKFRPFYEKLIMPLIKLSNLGYNYQGELIERELEELKHHSLVRRWYNILQTCEALGSLEIYEDPEASNSVSGDKQVLTFIGPEEAKLLHQRHVQSLNGELDGKNEVQKQIEYEPLASHNQDELWIIDQKELDNLVRKHKKNALASDRIRARLFRNLLSRMKDLLKSGKINIVANQLVDFHNMRSATVKTQQVDVREDLIRVVNEAVVEEEIEEAEKDGVELIDQAVAGNGRKTRKLRPVPKKTKYVPERRDGTKFSTKLYNKTIGRLLPNKGDIFFSFMGIIGVALLSLGLVMLVVGR